MTFILTKWLLKPHSGFSLWSDWIGVSKRCSNPVKNWTAKKTYICCECTAEPFSVDTKLKRVTIIKCIPEKQTLQAYKDLYNPKSKAYISTAHRNSPLHQFTKWELLRHPVTPDIPRHSAGLMSPQSEWCIARHCPVESTWWLSWLVNDIFHQGKLTSVEQKKNSK